MCKSLIKVDLKRKENQTNIFSVYGLMIENQNKIFYANCNEKSRYFKKNR